MSDARRKERQRLKRKKKAEKLRKDRGGGAFEQAARAGKIISCLICEDWKERGQAVLWVLRSVPERMPVMATYMIDLWCAGLKDAWGQQNMDHESFRGVVKQMEDGTGLKFVPCPVELAKRLTAGSIRFARQNGFRLPPNWQRWAALVGVEEADAADLSDFGKDGKLLWTAPLSDLRSRLVDSNAEEFMARPGVEAVFEPEDDDGGPEWEYDDGAKDGEDDEDRDGEEEDEAAREEFEDALLDSTSFASGKLVDGLRKWCFANGRLIHPRAAEAAMLILTSAIATDPEDPEGPGSESNRRKGMAAIQTMLAELPPKDRIELMQAMEQVQEFIRSFPDHEEMSEALGMNLPEDEDDEDGANA